MGEGSLKLVSQSLDGGYMYGDVVACHCVLLRTLRWLRCVISGKWGSRMGKAGVAWVCGGEASALEPFEERTMWV